ncbi:MAG: hypothetical protein D4R70_05085 [Betaproteobacteria bacterium]|jgi:hypothetical protein|nr:MAG: hypothetical protein D4R70_05085 [Betaproteobacteria bacterium]
MPSKTTLFWLGNTILGIALLLLFFTPAFFWGFGGGSMVAWMAIVSVGIYLITRDKGPDDTMPG